MTLGINFKTGEKLRQSLMDKLNIHETAGLIRYAVAHAQVADTKEAIGHGWANVKSFTFEKRDDFRANAKAMTSKMDAQMSELHANYPVRGGKRPSRAHGAESW